jgi:hypothetical protein
MKNLKFLPTMLSLVFALVCFHVSVIGQENKIATVSGGGDTVKWDITVAHSAATLTVSGPSCGVIRKEFKEESALTFSTYDKNGNRLPDGQYTYELRLTPVLSAETVKDLAAARKKGGVAEEDAECRVRSSNPTALVQSGAFTILRGSVVVAGAVESTDGRQAKRVAPRALTVPEVSYEQGDSFIPARYTEAFAPQAYTKRAGQPFAHPAIPDQVIPDDLIVQGSLCVGFDCVNNESFGFDTIRLKENNTRIKFEDTSVGSFPTNDWQLTANDSASGGASKFSIEDITGSKVPFTITAGAATNSIFVDSTGRLGLRTSTPVLDIHSNTSNTPAIRFEQNNSGGFTAQTWDIAGNEANFFIRDVTGGSRLPFRIRPGAPTSSLDISASGNVGIATASPDSALDVSGNTLTLGSESGNNSRGNNTTKLNRVAMPPYAIANLNFATFAGATTSTDNIAAFGGGAAGFSAATLITFHTGATTNTDTGSERMRINSSGNVGIGTTAPTQKLEVAGNIRVTGGSFIDDGVTLNAPDYVFESDYRLMTLDELRAFIARKKHLPNMPSAAEIRQNGLNLSQYQMKLLEKIEELTLHVLSEQKLRQEQQKEIEQLKAQVQQLRTVAPRKRRK